MFFLLLVANRRTHTMPWHGSTGGLVGAPEPTSNATETILSYLIGVRTVLAASGCVFGFRLRPAVPSPVPRYSHSDYCSETSHRPRPKWPRQLLDLKILWPSTTSLCESEGKCS